MFEAAKLKSATIESRYAFLPDYSRYSPVLVQRLGALILVLAVAMAAASCGSSAQASGLQNGPNNLNLHGILPGANVNESYNAVLAVSGGNSPYQFSVKTGSLPPGISLNPVTGRLSGTPTTAGSYSFAVIVTDAPHSDEGSQALAMIVAGGSGGGGSGNIRIVVSPTSVTLSSSQKQQFTASVSGTANTAVTWSATAGSVDPSGLYTAPAVNSQTTATVTATSSADTSKSASTTVTINPANNQKLQITTGTLPQGQQGETYSEVFAATGGTTPYSWNISAGTPPPGIAMNANGDFSGSPTSTGTFSFAVTVTDANKKSATGNFSVKVVAGSGYDGPAQLPIANFAGSMSETPAPGSVVTVNAGGDLQSALNNAQCGNTIALQAGATFTGDYTFPAKSCDHNHWIIVRTSAPDSSLPAEGQRVTPCYAGVASLPGRPQYSCNNPKNVLAKLILSGGGDGPIVFQSGANHYRLLGLEVTRPAGVKGGPALITVLGTGTANYIVLDRSWLHGTTKDDTRGGFELSGTNDVAVVDSYFTDFHCTAATGACTDAHAVSGGTGDHQDGPYEIRGNFLEASGEAVMFGGGGATTTPTDITVHYNHFFKPMQWMPGNSPFQGGESGNPFVVKNHMELKNAVRVLAEANLMENSWGGFSQNGFSILLTPKNQHTPGKGNVCPICEVTDVTIRYTHIAHAGGGIVMATAISGNGQGGAPAKAGTRWSIHDVVMDDISASYTGLGRLFMVSNNWPDNPVNTVTINHITGIPDNDSGGIMFLGNRTSNAAMYGFVFTNSIVITGRYPVWNVGGGNTSCAVSDVPLTSLNTCFKNYTFSNNALIAAPSHFAPPSWPTGNRFGPDPNSVGFVQYKNGNGGNYELQAGSPYKNMGSDGKDLGADVAGLDAALAGVE